MNKISGEKIKLSASSGSEMKMEVGYNYVDVERSRGSNVKISDTAPIIKADGSSGSDLNASALVADNGEVSASSGSSIDVQVTKDIKAHASSGASIKVLGNPATRDTNSSSGGSVHFK